MLSGPRPPGGVPRRTAPPSPNGAPASPPAAPTWTVTRLANAIKEKLQSERMFQGIWVEGEISNYTYHSQSDHIYFSLKDQDSVLVCTFFRYANLKFRHLRLENGMKILARGSVTAYGTRSTYQLNVLEVTLAGAGELRMRVERLKKALHAEGLFDAARKKVLPVLPVTIGVATAPDGAAVQDIIHVARARFPHINILLAPCVVQGVDAVGSIIAAIELLNDSAFSVDVIIAGRGGGSFEDLMAFNDEAVVRAFANSKVPIISAVGHEVDSVLSDFAADAFAATPSAAAQRAVPVLAEVEERIDKCGQRLKSSLRNRYRADRDRLRALLRARVFISPRTILLNERAQWLDDAAKEFRQAAQRSLKEKASQLRPSDAIAAHYKNLMSGFYKQFEIASERLANFSPLATLKRGYAIVRNAKHAVIRDPNDVKAGEKLEVLVDKGTLRVRVEPSA